MNRPNNSTVERCVRVKTKITRFCLISVILLSFVTIPMMAQQTRVQVPGSPAVRGDLGRTIDEYMSRLAVYGMSGALLVAKNGEVIVHKGYGLANRETKVPVGAESPFLIGSLTKQFVAAAIVKLEMQGKLRTDDTLGRFFPNAPADKRSITLHQLLTHTAGFPYLPAGDFFERKSRDAVMREMLDLPLMSDPGSEHAYSNTGYTLLSGVIEKASGESFESYLQQHLFEPAGMRSTGFEGDSARWAGPAAIHSYSGSADEGSVAEFPVAPKLWGAGGVVTTAGDLYRWELALRGDAVLSPAAKEKLFAPHAQAQGGASYGYGWNVVKTVRGTTVLAHAGDIAGDNVEYRRYIDEDLVVIFLSNVRSNGMGYRQAVMNNVSLIVAGSRYPVPPAVVPLESGSATQLAGTYRLPTGGTVHVSSDARGIILSSEGQDAVSLVAANDTGNVAQQEMLNQRAASIIEEISKGNIAPLAGTMHPSVPLQDGGAGILREWKSWTDSLGPFSRTELLGTAVLSPGAARTAMRLHFQRGSMTVTYGWGGGKIMSIDIDSDRPTATFFAPESSTAFASYDPFSGRSVRIEFHANRSGTVESLKFKTAAGEIVAPRVKGGGS